MTIPLTALNLGQHKIFKMGIDLKEKIANAIRSYLDQNDISINQLSEVTGIPDNTIGRILNKKNVTIEKIELVLNAIGATIDDLKD